MPLEIIVGAAVGAAVASPTIRKQLRKGLVYGLAGALIAYDKMSALAKEARGLHHSEAETSSANGEAAPVANHAAASSMPGDGSSANSSAEAATVGASH
jgi:hypothetical protein